VECSQLEPHIIHGRKDRLPNEALISICKDTQVEEPNLNPALEYYYVNRRMDTILLRESPVSHAEIALRLVPHSCKMVAKDDSRKRMLITQPPVADVVVGRSDTLWGLFETHNLKGVTIGDVLDAEDRRYGGGNSWHTPKFIAR
jgi:hypothetical protein